RAGRCSRAVEVRAEVVHHDLRAELGHEQRFFLPDAPARAGDDCDLAFEQHAKCLLWNGKTVKVCPSGGSVVKTRGATLRARLEHQVERRLGRAAEAPEPDLRDDAAQPGFAVLRPQPEADLLRQRGGRADERGRSIEDAPYRI